MSFALCTQQQPRYHLVHYDAANTASAHMFQDGHVKIIRKTRSSNNRTQYAIGYQFIYVVVNGHHLSIHCASGICRELYNQFITAHNGKPSWFTKAFAHTVSTIAHYDTICSESFTNALHHKHPWRWVKRDLITCQKATKGYMVDIAAESQFLK